jgi:hypothetical protein
MHPKALSANELENRQCEQATPMARLRPGRMESSLPSHALLRKERADMDEYMNPEIGSEEDQLAARFRAALRRATAEPAPAHLRQAVMDRLAQVRVEMGLEAGTI